MTLTSVVDQLGKPLAIFVIDAGRGVDERLPILNFGDDGALFDKLLAYLGLLLFGGLALEGGGLVGRTLDAGLIFGR